ncbi:MAG: YkgJ family cysteine cluster protein [Planctomycetota bacterium]|nr:YkgJ family cysteine cluster protein [Planctomycetota bacterium]
MTHSTQAFDFNCCRSGNCCRTGHGQVWLKEEEMEGMASEKKMTLEAFVRMHVRQVDGRFSIREAEHGRCSLLEGLNVCSVYEARPEQCRTFPFWPSLLKGGKALAAAAAYCPGLKIRKRGERHHV